MLISLKLIVLVILVIGMYKVNAIWQNSLKFIVVIMNSGLIAAVLFSVDVMSIAYINIVS